MPRAPLPKPSPGPRVSPVCKPFHPLESLFLDEFPFISEPIKFSRRHRQTALAFATPTNAPDIFLTPILRPPFPPPIVTNALSPRNRPNNHRPCASPLPTLSARRSTHSCYIEGTSLMKVWMALAPLLLPNTPFSWRKPDIMQKPPPPPLTGCCLPLPPPSSPPPLIH